MKRKEILQRLFVVGSGVFIVPTGLLNACKQTPKKRIVLTKNDIPLLDEIGETIIPTNTASPGAKAAKIGEYMFEMVTDCFSPDEQHTFLVGLDVLDNNSFIDKNTQEKLKFLKKMQVDKQHFFSMYKNLTISGYFSSEIGATQARKYQAVPGVYNGCIPYKEGDRPWAT
jgi:hypothetical protein